VSYAVFEICAMQAVITQRLNPSGDVTNISELNTTLACEFENVGKQA
jgi:hypothetical protein